MLQAYAADLKSSLIADMANQSLFCPRAAPPTALTTPAATPGIDWRFHKTSPFLPSDIVDVLDPLILRYAKERDAGERFGDFVVRTGVVKTMLAGPEFQLPG